MGMALCVMLAFVYTHGAIVSSANAAEHLMTPQHVHAGMQHGDHDHDHDEPSYQHENADTQDSPAEGKTQGHHHHADGPSGMLFSSNGTGIVTLTRSASAFRWGAVPLDSCRPDGPERPPRSLTQHA